MPGSSALICATCLRYCLRMRSLRLPMSFFSRETILCRRCEPAACSANSHACLFGLADFSAGKRYSLTHLRHDGFGRSEEHTSELQSLMRISYAVFCLKKKKIKKNSNIL